ncbi:iron-sulfur cluster co-chaperone protein HscB [Plutella xylostella]|uniref:iron-sulfur cluster co-chaperone protein HscB n=1 Tax=Plutella xylostella TaxID=51655 RepID=UPI0020324257|nr:iron-sulfur cluster co-chaperone protein HscB [Plutella xylostella]
MNFMGRVVTNTMIKCVFSQNTRFISCWSCGKDAPTLVSNLFCPNCKSLQKPNKSDNYFKVIGVQETYNLDPNVLAKRYKELQKFLHPDKFANRDSKELEVSEEYSSLVNEAYNTLLEPLARGIYMLRLKGQEIPEQTDHDPEFLMEIMEINEAVESAETEADIMKLNKENKSVIESLQKQLSSSFSDGDMKQVTKLLARLKYYTSIENQIQGAIRSKGIIR